MRVLCVAEKPSAAKKIAEILSQNSFSTSSTDDKYVKNYRFTYNLNNRPTSFCMTSLRGHVLNVEFADLSAKSWQMFPTINLFDIPILKQPSADCIGIVRNLKREAREADILFIWTDCDREGEAIGGEVVEICHSVKPNLPVWRARFSSMLPDQIHHAAQNQIELDERQVEAVNARTELDLRIGATFTRLQTLRLRSHIGNGAQFQKKVISYGSCQFPTLGFVVSRYLLIERFVPEAFWKIQMSYTQPAQEDEEGFDDHQEIKTNFTWRRNHLFNRWACLIFMEKCIEAKVARVKKVVQKQTQKWKPLPLTTVEMQKVGCRVLNMSGEQIMKVAEELYVAGLISYPRTETDQYDRAFDFMPFIQKQRNDPAYGAVAALLCDGEFERPRNGKNNDKAHPPIHPTSYSASLSGNQRRLYEFITRRFLGSCWKNAKGFETTVEVEMGGELFDAKGLVILERNYLEVYTYDKWNGHYIPEFKENDEFIPTQINMVEGATTPPNLLTEPDLIGLMEKNEIGTDATIAEHIQKIIEREYVFKRGRYFRPSTLGIALVLGYDEIGFESSLSQPFLRREMEADLKRICDGSKTKRDVLLESISKYRDMFLKSESEFNKMIESVRTNYRQEEDRTGGAGAQRGIGQEEDDDEAGSHQNGSGSNNTRGRGRGRGRGAGGSGSGGGGGGGGGGNGGGPGSRGGRGSRGGPGSRGGRTRNHGTNEPSRMPEHIPNCGHQKPSVIRTSRKENSKGRQFFTCGDSFDQCDYFQWVDELPGNNYNNNNNHNAQNNYNNNNNNHNNNTRNNYNNNNNNNNTSVPTCQCGNPVVQLTVTKNSPNKGRAFYSCQNRTEGCGFFEWCD